MLVSVSIDPPGVVVDQTDGIKHFRISLAAEPENTAALSRTRISKSISPTSASAF